MIPALPVMIAEETSRSVASEAVESATVKSPPPPPMKSDVLLIVEAEAPPTVTGPRSSQLPKPPSFAGPAGPLMEVSVPPFSVSPAPPAILCALLVAAFAESVEPALIVIAPDGFPS